MTPATLIEAIRYFSNLTVCHEYMRKIKWPDGKVCCPKCGTEKCTEIKSRPGWLTCNKPDCRKQFSLRENTIFADSPVPLGVWFCAVWIVANSEAIGSPTFAKLVGVTNKTAWRMLRLIRAADSMIKIAPDEKWQPVIEYEGLYEVSNYGRIRGLARIRRSRSGRTATVGPRIILTHRVADPHKHWIVTLAKDGVRKTHPLHCVILAAFCGPCPNEMQCRHLDGNPANNNLENLCWGTPLENAADRDSHGTTAKGERNASASLTDEQVK